MSVLLAFLNIHALLPVLVFKASAPELFRIPYNTAVSLTRVAATKLATIASAHTPRLIAIHLSVTRKTTRQVAGAVSQLKGQIFEPLSIKTDELHIWQGQL